LFTYTTAFFLSLSLSQIFPHRPDNGDIKQPKSRSGFTRLHGATSLKSHLHSLRRQNLKPLKYFFFTFHLSLYSVNILKHICFIFQNVVINFSVFGVSDMSGFFIKYRRLFRCYSHELRSRGCNCGLLSLSSFHIYIKVSVK
jgi:hypothetical protein